MHNGTTDDLVCQENYCLETILWKWNSVRKS